MRARKEFEPHFADGRPALAFEFDEEQSSDLGVL